MMTRPMPLLCCLALLACAPRLSLGELGRTAPAPPVPERPSEDALSWTARAVRAEILGDEAEALRSWAWVTRLEPGDVWAWLALAEAGLRLGELDTTERALAMAEAVVADHPRAWWARGRLLRARGESGGVWMLRAAQAGVEEAWPDALAALGPEAVLEAWQGARVGPLGRRERLAALLAHGGGGAALADARWLFEYVPTPEGLLRWAQLAQNACEVGPVLRWVEDHEVATWSLRWAEAGDVARAARCEGDAPPPGER